MYQSSIARTELKYIISTQEYVYLKSLLQAILEPDPHGDDHGDYFVRSLYLDTTNNQDYQDKDGGLLERQKIRFRLYDLDSEMVKLEIKNKFNHNQLKNTCLIHKSDMNDILNGHIDCLLKYPNEKIQNIYQHLKKNTYMPVVLIDYIREAYIHEAYGIRINFDKQISASFSMDLFDKDSYLPSIMEDNQYVLEVKYGYVMPDFIRDILSSVKLCKTSYSKYIYAREARATY